MNLIRGDFEPDTLAVLDQIALLLYITEQLRKTAATFDASPELDRGHAQKDARFILKFTWAISKGLMSALYLNATNRDGRLADTYKEAAEGLEEAIRRATRLSNQMLSANCGNVIQVAVLGNLNRLKAAWVKQ